MVELKGRIRSMIKEKKTRSVPIEEIEEMKEEIDLLTQKLIQKRLDRFSKKDVTNALFGALTVGLTFVFKGLLIEVGMNLPWSNVIMIITMTLFILTNEIYFIGYSHVEDRKERPFSEFLYKRLFAMYGIALMVSFFLLYLFGFIYLAGSLENFSKLIFIVAMPSAIGAAIPSMLKPN